MEIIWPYTTDFKFSKNKSIINFFLILILTEPTKNY